MSTFDKYWRKIPNRYGYILFALLTVYFLAMRFAGLGHVYWLRATNLVIVFFIIRASILNYKKNSDASYYESFFDFFKIAIRTAFIGIGLFAIFMALYLDQVDLAFMEEIRTVEKISPYISPVSAAFLIFIEGMGSAFVCSYLAIQILKNRTVDRPIEDTTKPVR